MLGAAHAELETGAFPESDSSYANSRLSGGAVGMLVVDLGPGAFLGRHQLGIQRRGRETWQVAQV